MKKLDLRRATEMLSNVWCPEEISQISHYESQHDCCHPSSHFPRQVFILIDLSLFDYQKVCKGLGLSCFFQGLHLVHPVHQVWTQPWEAMEQSEMKKKLTDQQNRGLVGPKPAPEYLQKENTVEIEISNSVWWKSRFLHHNLFQKALQNSVPGRNT